MSWGQHLSRGAEPKLSLRSKKCRVQTCEEWGERNEDPGPVWGSGACASCCCLVPPLKAPLQSTCLSTMGAVCLSGEIASGTMKIITCVTTHSLGGEGGGHGRLVWSEREAGHGMTLPVPQGRGADPFKGQHMSEGWAPRTGRVRK